MLDTTWGRWTIAVIAALCIVALLAWARNDPGVDDRDPDPPSSNVVVAVVPVPEAPTTVDSVPPTT